MSNKFVNHARNVWTAVTLPPRVDQFWYKYVHMEEMMGQIANARAIFERWMRWEPDHNGWNAYIRMETRYKEGAACAPSTSDTASAIPPSRRGCDGPSSR